MNVRAKAGAHAANGRDDPAHATRITVATMGVLAALAGVEHGVGEIRQGWVPPPAWVFKSWEGTPAFGPVNGEPAMTVVPNLFVTGVLTVVVAFALGLWAVRFAERRHGGLVLIALSVLLLVVGGGFGPALIGVLAGVLATRSGTTPSAPLGPVSGVLAGLWPWLLVATVTFFLGLVPGTVLLYLAVGIDTPALVAGLTAAAFATAVLAVLGARGRDRAQMTAATSR